MLGWHILPINIGNNIIRKVCTACTVTEIQADLSRIFSATNSPCYQSLNSPCSLYADGLSQLLIVKLLIW